MQKLKSVEHDYLTDNVIKVLAQNRITTILEFLQQDIEKLSTIAKLTLPQILVVRNNIFRKYSAPIISSTSLLVKSYNTKGCLSTGIQSLDDATHGGLPMGSITEICGFAGTGKTQLCCQLAINCAKKSQNTVLYVDTKGDFSANKIQTILDAYRFSPKEMAMTMFKIKVVHVWTMADIIELFKKLKNTTIQFENLSLIIIDSLPCLMFQHLGDENKVGLTFLNTLVNYSRYLSKEFHLAIVCVNLQTRWVDQDIADVEDDGEDSVVKDLYVEKRNRCLGKYWQHVPSLVLILEKPSERNTYAVDDDSSKINVTITSCNKTKSNMCTLKLSRLGVT